MIKQHAFAIALLCCINPLNVIAQVYSDTQSHQQRVRERIQEWREKGISVAGYTFSVEDVDRLAQVEIARKKWLDQGIAVHAHAFSASDVDRMGEVEKLRRQWANKGISITQHAYSSTDLERIAQVEIARRRYAALGIRITQYAYSVEDLERMAQVEIARKKYTALGIRITQYAYSVEDVERMAAVEIAREKYAASGIHITQNVYSVDDLERVASVEKKRREYASRGVHIDSPAFDVAALDQLAASQTTRPLQFGSTRSASNALPLIAVPNVSSPKSTARDSRLYASTPSYNDSNYYNPNYRPPVSERYVRPYVRSNGEFVEGHIKTNPDDSFWNNYSSKGNVNPYSGKIGSRLPPTAQGSSSTYVDGYYKSNGTYVKGHYRRK